MVLEILCVEPIYPQYSGVLETYLALRYCFFEVLGSESFNPSNFDLFGQDNVHLSKSSKIALVKNIKSH